MALYKCIIIIIIIITSPLLLLLLNPTNIVLNYAELIKRNGYTFFCSRLPHQCTVGYIRSVADSVIRHFQSQHSIFFSRSSATWSLRSTARSLLINAVYSCWDMVVILKLCCSLKRCILCAP